MFLFIKCTQIFMCMKSYIMAESLFDYVYIALLNYTSMCHILVLLYCYNKSDEIFVYLSFLFSL